MDCWKKENCFTLVSENDSPVKEDWKYLQNPLSLRYLTSSEHYRGLRISKMNFDEYYKEIKKNVSQYAKAEIFFA